MIARHIRRNIRRVMFALPAAAALTAVVGPLLVPVPPLKGVFPPRSLADPDSHFIEINGQDVHVKTCGQGELTFVLLHGFSASLYSFHAVMDPLCQMGRVIAYDRTGFGLSARPLTWKGQNPYSAAAQVDQLVGILDAFEVKQAILVGSSAGGTISLSTAIQYPERISALVLIDPAVYLGERIPAWLQPLLSTPQARHLGPLIARQIVTRGPELLDMAWHDPSLIPPQVQELYRKPFQVENWDRALWEFTQANRPPDLPRHLGEVRQPALVITGDDDRIVPTRDTIRLAGELPNAQLVVIPNTGHLPHEENPALFMDAVTSFMHLLSAETG